MIDRRQGWPTWATIPLLFFSDNGHPFAERIGDEKKKNDPESDAPVPLRARRALYGVFFGLERRSMPGCVVGLPFPTDQSRST